MRTKHFKNEKFKFLKGSDKYLISNYGRVFNLNSFEFLALNINSNGYPRVEIYSGINNGIRQRKQIFLHLAVVETFGDCNGNSFANMDENEIINVDHLDRDRRNCRQDNLELVTAKENQARKYYDEKKLQELQDNKKIKLDEIF